MFILDRRKTTLACLRGGEKAIITNLLGGREMRKKLNALGLREGKEIHVISKMIYNGPLTVQIDQTSLALGRGLAEKIVVLRNEGGRGYK